MKIGIGGEGSAADLRRRSGLERRATLLEARRAVRRRRLKPEDGCEGTAMNDALPRVASGLEAQRVDVSSPGAGHVKYRRGQAAGPLAQGF